jgi:hypothetical protein
MLELDYEANSMYIDDCIFCKRTYENNKCGFVELASLGAKFLVEYFRFYMKLYFVYIKYL